MVDMAGDDDVQRRHGCLGRAPDYLLGSLGRNVHGASVVAVWLLAIRRGSHVTVASQAFERVLCLVVHGSTRALTDSGPGKLVDDLVECGGGTVDGRRDIAVAERPESLAIPREIQIHDRNSLPADVSPDVDFAPLEEWVDAEMGIRTEVRIELSPEFGGLTPDIPIVLRATRTENAFLCASAFFIPPDTGNDPVELLARDYGTKPGSLTGCRPRCWGQRRIHVLEGRTGSDHQAQIPFLRIAVAKRVHLGKFLSRIYMDHRKRNPPEERLAREPHQHVRILAQRPQQGNPIETDERLTQNVDALPLQNIQVSHRHHFQLSREERRLFSPDRRSTRLNSSH